MWLPFLTHKLGGSWGAWEGLERYLRGSREHLEGVWRGLGRASEEPTKLRKFGEVLNSQGVVTRLLCFKVWVSRFGLKS